MINFIAMLFIAPIRTLVQLSRAVTAIQQMYVDAPLVLTKNANGVPCIALDGQEILVTKHVQFSANLTIGGTALAQPVFYDGAAWMDDSQEKEITVTDWELADTANADDFAIVQWHGQSQQWHVIRTQKQQILPINRSCCKITHYTEGIVVVESEPCASS